MTFRPARVREGRGAADRAGTAPFSTRIRGALRAVPRRILSGARKKPLAAAFLLGGALYLLLAQIFTGAACLTYSMTGFPCPTCGATRAARAFLSGEFAKGLALYPAAPAVFLMLLTAFLRLFVLRGRFRKITAAVLLILGAVIFARYIWGMAALFPRTPPYIFNPRAFLPRLRELLF